MKELDRKIAEVFPNEFVYKDDKVRALFSGVYIPSFIKDWIIKRFLDERTYEIDKEGLRDFLRKYIPSKDENIKGFLVANPGVSKKIITRVITEPDVKSGEIRFSIPDLKIQKSEGVVPSYLTKENPKLRGGEQWGVVELTFYKDENKLGYIELSNFKPFQPYEVDIEYFIHARKEFSFEEWIDLLIKAMEYNPEGFIGITQKLQFLLRLLVFVEPNLNIIELAPKGTGKSYVFGNLSKYGWLISGGYVSRAKLFYDISKNMEGIVARYDFIALDEIQTIRFNDQDEIRGVFKSYLENGTFNVSNYRGSAGAGFILLGNISLSEDRKPINKVYFQELPEVFQESALIDRFHGFIEGWKLPRMNEAMKVKGITLNVEFFSEILHRLRSYGEFTAFFEENTIFPANADTRDKKAIVKIGSALLKLLFPNIPFRIYPSKEEFRLCVNIAKEMRAIIKEQLSFMDQEYSKQVPSVELK